MRTGIGDGSIVATHCGYVSWGQIVYVVHTARCRPIARVDDGRDAMAWDDDDDGDDAAALEAIARAERARGIGLVTARAVTGAVTATDVLGGGRASGGTAPTTAPRTCELALCAPGDRFAVVAMPGVIGAVDGVVGDGMGWDVRDARGRRTIPAERRVEATRTLESAGFRVIQPPLMVIRCAEMGFDEHEREARAVYDARVPREMDAKMFDFQREGVMYELRRGGRALIGDEMGLGKTVQACALLACYKDECPALILVPTSLREAWRNALQSWLDADDGDIAVVGAANEAKKLDEGRMYNIVPYSLCVKLKDRLRERRYKVIVADESHFLKDRRAQRTQAVMPLMKDGAASRVICLTGTPALSRPIELFSQLEALVPRIFFRLHDYGTRYCQGGAPFGMYTGCSRADELHVMISKLCMVRRLKRDVLKSLPPKQRTQQFLTVEKSCLGDVRRIKTQLDKLREAGGSEFEEKRLLNELFLASAKAKVNAVCDYLETLIDGSASEKFIFFAHHGVMLDAVSAFLEKKKCKHIRIDGSTPSAARGELVNKFQRDDSTRIAVLSIKAAGMGLTLTAASTVIFGEMVWTPGDLIQAEDRAHRIGQASSVLVQYLHARETIDEIIWQTIRRKLDTLGTVLNGQSGDHLEATTAGSTRRTSEETSPRSTKKQKLAVVDVTQRTLIEMFSSQATQKSSPAGEDPTTDDELFTELAARFESKKQDVGSS